MKDLFLDANAHVPMSDKSLQAYVDFNNSLAGHGHPLSPSVTGREAANVLEESRDKIAQLIGAESPSQVVFTNSCTQACEWAIKLLKSNSIFISPIEHPAVIRAAESSFNHMVKMPLDQNGVVAGRNFENNNVVCIHVQNEAGTIQPVGEINCNILFSDMSQSLGKIGVNVTDLGVDIATFGAHKFGGPGGVGFMYLKDTNLWKEFGTGSRYFMDSPGTPNVAGIYATSAALEEAIKTLPERTEKMVEFRLTLEDGLKELGFKIIGEGTKRSPNTTFAKVPCSYGRGNCGLALMLELGDMGVYGVHVGLGSACGSLYTGNSPVMEALGEPSDGQDYIRISQWGEYGKEEAEFVLTRIQNARIGYA